MVHHTLNTKPKTNKSGIIRLGWKNNNKKKFLHKNRSNGSYLPHINTDFTYSFMIPESWTNGPGNGVGGGGGCPFISLSLSLSSLLYVSIFSFHPFIPYPFPSPLTKYIDPQTIIESFKILILITKWQNIYIYFTLYSNRSTSCHVCVGRGCSENRIIWSCEFSGYMGLSVWTQI